MKNINEIANQIIKLENEYRKTSNSALEVEIMELIKNLSFNELAALDDYILEKNFLTK